MKISLIITTYNWPGALRLVLLSVLDQSRLPDEVIIADDGSKEETGTVIKTILAPSGLRWCHVRHEDRGVRQSRVKNMAVKHSRFDYLIFIDHDVVLHPEFVSDHLRMAQADCFLQGKRVILPKHYTEKAIKKGYFNAPVLWLRGLGNRKNSIRSMFLGSRLSRLKNFETSLRGCNLSMFRSDYFKVDGFDEIYDQSWGREDSDICYRLFHAGVKIKTLWFMALQYHLYHPIFSKWDKERLDAELQRNLNKKRIIALRGLSTLSSEGMTLSSSADF